MPYGLASHNYPQLTNEEAWDVCAAFVVSQPRPEKFFDEDWPQKEKKPVDFPYGPYAAIFPKSSISMDPLLLSRKRKNKK